MPNKRWKHWFDTLYFYQLILLFRPTSVNHLWIVFYIWNACRSTLKHLPIGIMTIICVLILFPLLTLASLTPAPFPAYIYPRVSFSLLTDLDFRLFDSEVYYRALSANFPTRFDQAGNKSSVASKLLLHTYTWVQMVKAKGRWDVRERKKGGKGEKDERGRTSKGDRW